MIGSKDSFIISHTPAILQLDSIADANYQYVELTVDLYGGFETKRILLLAHFLLRLFYPSAQKSLAVLMVESSTTFHNFPLVRSNSRNTGMVETSTKFHNVPLRSTQTNIIYTCHLWDQVGWSSVFLVYPCNPYDATLLNMFTKPCKLLAYNPCIF